MKYLFLILSLSITVAIHAQVKIAKINKVEQLEAKDEYGKVKDGVLKLKFTLSSGQTEVYEKKLVINDIYAEGTETWQYLGLNFSKNAFVMLKYWDNGGYDNHYEVCFYEYRFNTKSKKFKLEKLEYGPDMPFSGLFSIDDGWAFGSLSGEFVSMFKDGEEFILFTDKKTNGIRYVNISEPGLD